MGIQSKLGAESSPMVRVSSFPFSSQSLLSLTDLLEEVVEVSPGVVFLQPSIIQMLQDLGPLLGEGLHILEDPGSLHM